MTTSLNYNNINYKKNVQDLGFKVESWVSDLTFFKTEIDFLKDTCVLTVYFN